MSLQERLKLLGCPPTLSIVAEFYWSFAWLLPVIGVGAIVYLLGFGSLCLGAVLAYLVIVGILYVHAGRAVVTLAPFPRAPGR